MIAAQKGAADGIIIASTRTSVRRQPRSLFQNTSGATVFADEMLYHSGREAGDRGKCAWVSEYYYY